jgi:hypothetical protein
MGGQKRDIPRRYWNREGFTTNGEECGRKSLGHGQSEEGRVVITHVISAGELSDLILQDSMVSRRVQGLGLG